MQNYQAKLLRKEQIAPDVLFLKFELHPGQQLEFIAGQYLILLVPTPTGDPARRLFSIASSDSQKESFELLVKLMPEGLASDYFRGLEIGDSAYFQGPAGLFTLKSEDKQKIFLATGTGIAPVRSQISSYLEKDGLSELFLFWGLKNRGNLYLFEEWKNLMSSRPNFHFQICLDQEPSFLGLDVDHFQRGRVDQGLADFFKENKIPASRFNDYEYYLCGARETVESLKDFLEGLGVDKKNIFFDKF